MECGNTSIYKRFYSDSGYPCYTCPADTGQHKEFFYNEVLFLPIEYDVFKNNREDYFYGYRFFTTTPGPTTIAFLPGLGLPQPNTEIQLTFEVARIRYFMEDDFEHDIVIDYFGDGLFPPRTVTINQSTSHIRDTINTVTKQLIDQHCCWYADRKV